MRDQPPTTDQIRHAIDAGQAGDKVAFPDPAAAPLGTDDEASGFPPTAEQLDMTVEQTVSHPPKSRSWHCLLMPTLIVIPLIVVLLVFATTT